MVDAKPQICLSMIVKNEIEVIERCLESVKPFIDCWMISDTGSTDGTQDKIYSVMDGIPGCLIDNPWMDFGTNRTQALQRAYTFSADLAGHGDYDSLYTLVIDADDVLTPLSVTEAHCQLKLDIGQFDCYELKVEDHGISYYRPHLFKSAKPFFYNGILHEYLDCGDPYTKSKLDGLIYTRLGGGHRSSNPDKFKNDAEIFRKALKSEPSNSAKYARYLFYLAQSLKDAGDARGALKAYEKRANTVGWIEETWQAQYEVANMCRHLRYASSTINEAYLKAFELRPCRVEPLYQLANYYRTIDNHALAFVYAKAATGLPKPDDRLFIDESIYNWKVLDEYAISAYYVGYKEESYAANSKLLLEGWRGVPENEKDRIRNNMKFSENR